MEDYYYKGFKLNEDKTLQCNNQTYELNKEYTIKDLQ